MSLRPGSVLLTQNSFWGVVKQNERLFSYLCCRSNAVGCFEKGSTAKFRRLLLPSVQSKSYFSTNRASNMRFVQFTSKHNGPRRLGVQLCEEGDIIDVSGVDHSIPNDMVAFLKEGNGLLERTKRVVAEGKSLLPYDSVNILPPVISPDKVVCVGLNYKGHCEEQNLAFPEEPMFFSKFSSCITGPFDSVLYPTVTKELDWEVELAVVIGKTAKDVRPANALDHVFGYTIAQDLSARDWQKKRNNGQFLLGKAMDQFCPLGPVVVTKEAIPDPHCLRIRSIVNGVLKQDGNTNELIHRIDHIISFLSHVLTLRPGDVILTGTPAGVGMHRKPPEYLKPGDILESEIDCIGKMKNEIISESC